MVTDGKVPLTGRRSQALGLGLGLEFPNPRQKALLYRWICTWVPLLTGILWCNELLIRAAWCLTLNCTAGPRLNDTSPTTGAAESPGILPGMPWATSIPTGPWPPIFPACPGAPAAILPFSLLSIALDVRYFLSLSLTPVPLPNTPFLVQNITFEAGVYLKINK